VTVCLAAGLAPAAGISADKVLEMFGRREGLCVIVGCGGDSTSLAADLAATRTVFVHAIALDDKSLSTARDAVTKKDADGLATIEKLPLKPLPHRDNLANIVVVPDMAAAAAAGLTADEAMRIVAPGGKLCINRKGKWEVTPKSRPSGMDVWTHPYHGAGGGLVSNDKTIEFPMGLRWHDGLPYNLMLGMHNANRWTSVRAMVVSGNRCFSLSSSVIENVGRTFKEMNSAKKGQDLYLTARDAFNGLLLWRVKLGDLYYGGLHVNNRAPMAVGGGRVYTASEGKKLIALDAATGKTVATFGTAYIPGRILLDSDTVVAATWKEGSHIGGVHGIDRRRMEFSVAEGTVEAFDVKGGKKLWSLDKLATFIRSADGNLYMIQRGGADPIEGRKRGKGPQHRRPKRKLVAVDLRSGKQVWEVGAESMSLGVNDHVFVDVAGLGVVTACINNGRRTVAFGAKDGKILLDVKSNSYAGLYDGKIHVGGKMYDPKTGQPVTGKGIALGSTVCTPRIYVNGITTNNRGCGYTVKGKPMRYEAARGACMFAAIPANGAFYVAQNWCRCAPGQIAGLISFGPVGRVPTPEEIQKPPVVQKGPAFGKVSEKPGKQDWPMYRGGPSRGSAAESPAPSSIKVLWSSKVAALADDTDLGKSWKESLTSPLTAPVAAEGIVLTADIHRHKVVALDPKTGKELWRRTVGGRVDTPPTIYKGICLFGSHDGMIYALRAADGQTVWKMRMAPEEARMIAYGQVESPWPVIGSVLVSRGSAYASAGRTTGSEGGLVMRKFDPISGKVTDTKVISRGPYLNDIITECNAGVHLMKYQEHDRKPEANSPHLAPNLGIEGIMRGNWTKLGNRKSGVRLGGANGDMVSWSDKTVLRVSGQGASVQALSQDAKAKRPKTIWSHGCPAGGQITSAVICPNAVVIGGGLYPPDSKTAKKGFVRVLSPDKGTQLAEITFDVPLTYDGLAVAGGKIYITLTDGSAACLGEK